MTQDELNTILETVAYQCEAAGVPLNKAQREILQRVASRHYAAENNPLDALLLEQRQSLLQFVREQTTQNRSWKAQLLNDWLSGRDSGSMQFVRDEYGLQWLEQVEPEHIAAYLEEATTSLTVGDRIEVANTLWEWTQEDGPCRREWFPCTVVSICEEITAIGNGMSCTVRFDNGMEYEIQGIYDWNRSNWRWVKARSRE